MSSLLDNSPALSSPYAAILRALAKEVARLNFETPTCLFLMRCTTNDAGLFFDAWLLAQRLPWQNNAKLPAKVGQDPPSKARKTT